LWGDSLSSPDGFAIGVTDQWKVDNLKGVWELVDVSSDFAPSRDGSSSGEFFSSCWESGGFNNSSGHLDGSGDGDDGVIVVDVSGLSEVWMLDPGAYTEFLVQTSVVKTSHSNSGSQDGARDFAVTSGHDVGGTDDSSSAEVAARLLKGYLPWGLGSGGSVGTSDDSFISVGNSQKHQCNKSIHPVLFLRK
jgi:hypothetical protein